MKPYNLLAAQPNRMREPWAPFVVRANEWRAGVAEALDSAVGPTGRREISLRHPQSPADNPSVAPGIEVRFGTLKPGEQQQPLRCNATQFCMLLDGQAAVEVAGAVMQVGVRDSWVVPGMRSHLIRNIGSVPLVYVAYSNAALLRRLEAYYEDQLPGGPSKMVANRSFQRARDLAGPGHQLNDSGAMILPYEYLVDPDTNESNATLWRWSEIEPHLPAVTSLGKDYNGRSLWVLYNPATERKVGTTPCFFASIAVPGKHVVTPFHLHISAAINFILDGEGSSDVDQQHLEWNVWDIMLSAPSWMRHRHAVRELRTTFLTIQDHPFHIGMESLLWQEKPPQGPIMNLGTEAGFNTNRAEVLPA
jgi:gentisate 1,2-dioxygenase